MDFKSYKASAPGSIMLFGEHAVLHGKQAVVTAINKCIYIELIPQPNDNNIQIISSEFDKCVISLNKFKIIKPYNYILTAIKQYLNYFKKNNNGFILNIKSDFPANIGFGSSAAVTVATLGVLALWLEKKRPDLIQLYKQAVKIIRLVSGVGSGADVAASVFGGVIAYKISPLKIQKLSVVNLPLVAVYSGYKTSTNVVIAEVEKKRAIFQNIFIKLYSAINNCAESAITAIKKNDLVKLGLLMNINQGLQDAIGTSDTVLSDLIFCLRAKPNIYGAKISGAGLGDCVIGLGKITADALPKNNINIAVNSSGVALC